MAPSKNPLLSPFPQSSNPFPFDQIDAAEIEPSFDVLLSEAKTALDRLANEPRDLPRTFANTLLALEQIADRVVHPANIVAHLESVATTPSLRAANTSVQPKVSEFLNSIALSSGVFDALTRFSETAEAKQLGGAKKRLLEKTLADFRRNGAMLNEADKERLRAVDLELTETTIRYAQNVLDSTIAFEVYFETADDLRGLPDSALQAARRSAESKQKKGYRLTLQAPSYVPAITYVDNPRVREQLYRAHTTRATSGATDNRPLVAKIIALRAEKAKILGFSTFADLMLDDRMAKTGAQANAFVQELRSKILTFFEKENRELEQYRNDQGAADTDSMKPWDVPYYAERLRRERFDFDEEELRDYLPSDKVVAGVFDVAKRLYGIQIAPVANCPVWDASVRAYDMRDSSGSLLARFYLDLFPRETKQDGAWMHGIIHGENGAPHVAVVVANVTPPPSDSEPALLNRREVETLFHEFGHLLHHCLTRVEFRSLAGTNVATDFVELPSKIMENWCWEREALDLFARHRTTNEVIPDGIFTKMLRARTYRAANAQMRQLGFSAVDLMLHSAYEPARDGDAFSVARKLFESYSPVALPNDYAMIGSFTHLFADPVGYAAGYYSYQWAEVLDADAFTRFKKEGIFSRDAGDAFQTTILSSGNSQDPMELFEKFIGRKPRVEALLERSGLFQ